MIETSVKYGSQFRITLAKDHEEMFELIIPLDDFSFGNNSKLTNCFESVNASDLDVILMYLNNAVSAINAKTHEIKDNDFKITRFEAECDGDIKISFRDKKYNEECVTMEFRRQVPSDDEHVIFTATQFVKDRLREAISDIKDEFIEKSNLSPKDTAELKM